MLGQLQRAVYEMLNHFDEALDLYAAAMHADLPLVEFAPSLEAAGIPHRHVERMSTHLPQYFGSALWGTLSRWDAFNIATNVLTHDVQVNPERERQFERAAARALLGPGPLGTDPAESAPV